MIVVLFPFFTVHSCEQTLREELKGMTSTAKKRKEKLRERTAKKKLKAKLKATGGDVVQEVRRPIPSIALEQLPSSTPSRHIFFNNFLNTTHVSVF